MNICPWCSYWHYLILNFTAVYHTISFFFCINSSSFIIVIIITRFEFSHPGPAQYVSARVGALGRLIIWCSLKSIFSQLFHSWTGLACAQIVDNFQRNSSICWILSLVVPYFRLFQWCLSAPFRLPPCAAVGFWDVMSGNLIDNYQ